MKIANIILYLFLTVFTLSCNRKALLEPGHDHGVEVEISVKLNSNVQKELNTQSVNVVFEPLSKTAQRAVVKIKGSSSIIKVTPGSYRLLIYTSDFFELDAIMYRGLESIATTESYTRQATKNRNKSDIKSVYMVEPDPLFVKMIDNIEIKPGKNVIEETLNQMSHLYWFTVDIDGLEHITSASLEISGMYTSVYLANGLHRDNEEGTKIVETEKRLDEKKIYGEFWAFGPHQREDINHRMILTFVNGRTIAVPLNDVTTDIKKLTTGGEIVINQKLVINVDDTGAGFNPGVDDWEDVEVDIPI